MKKTVVRRVARAAEPMIGSTAGAGVDVSGLYIDMLCERFKDRGIRTVGGTGKKSAALSGMPDLFAQTVSASDPKYRTMTVNGRSCMSSDDFAAYYKDLRGYKMPKFFSRDEREYKEAELLAKKNVQESGKTPKKALWLAIKGAVKKKAKEIPANMNREGFERFSAEWFPRNDEKTMVDEKGGAMPRGGIAIILAVTLSLMLIVCSTVMVSRASWEVGRLEYRLERLEKERDDLATDLEVKNNLLEIQRIAVGEYGMISGDYAASRYIDVTEEEKIEMRESGKEKDSLLMRLMRAIGFSE